MKWDEEIRDDQGKFPAYAWPGGYPLAYHVADGGILCPACANQENGSIASVDADDDAQWHLIGYFVHWEGEPIACDHCHTEIESAYGNPDD